MAKSLITKKRIAKAFKKQLEVKPFDKISVVDIMDYAQIRRQTFYNHFLDKYELLDWIFETELQEQVTNNLNYISGFQLLDELVFYFSQNRSFYAQLFDIKGQNDFYSYFGDYCNILMEKIISEYEEKMTISIDSHYRTFLKSYHAKALADIIKSFVTINDYQPQMSYIKTIILTSIRSNEE
ncbi:dihydroxyacetone kinase transcriptional activator DhaS [Streptococcus iniae]|uniref:Dihydroxyacetone kinase n=1 Tax=Streptococcus iniae TaxID=1346 RepID=A0ABM5QIZ5_STRIN|nr:dihydroxyacetone kinase transcriptional activator DhaS [Streptococcus iniae]AGM99197.1 putative dihydroxyacetone kinase regulator [Streptococcus iniae SF1]AHY16135.1 dihydroxyacetone kinase [Streptococcus iniae]AHY17998.1 dihydroxyacetone kinase [Streptococcus iniae]AJG26292.1 dihydroxyacetone kinase [Streptococcus iniae]APD32170.1 dihydroxyacetone kinase transcriptional activator DhaS [Streptococcus iniae]